MQISDTTNECSEKPRPEWSNHYLKQSAKADEEIKTNLACGRIHLASIPEMMTPMLELIRLERMMEEMANQPRETVGVRQPGEKGSYEKCSI